MSDTNKPGMGFEVNIRRKASKHPESSSTVDIPFCIAILANFGTNSGLATSDKKSLSQRKFIEIDRDNFDKVLAKHNPKIDITSKDQPYHHFTISITNMDDFHPDNLYEKLEIFSKLRSIRRRLKDKSSFEEASSEIMGWLVPENPPVQEPPGSNEQSNSKNLPQADLLDNILESTQQISSEDDFLTSPGGIDQYIKQIIAPYVEPSDNPRQQEMLDAVDLATAEQMRHILHHPNFQAVEATWRSVDFLISRIETDRNLRIYLLDISKQELDQDLSNDVTSSVLHKLFCEPVINDIQWSLLVGNYLFEDNINDVLLLSQLGSIAQRAQAPFIAGGTETLADCESFAKYPDADDWQYALKPGFTKVWDSLRKDTVADYIGLALPRFLLRIPYGKKSDPVESFQFEETIGRREEWHEKLLWGNAAFIKAEQLARAFTNKHWEMNPADAGKTQNLPTHYYHEDGETCTIPCAEIYLTEKGGRKISERGLIPLWSVKNIDEIRSSDFNAVSTNAKSLQGRWTNK